MVKQYQKNMRKFVGGPNCTALGFRTLIPAPDKYVGSRLTSRSLGSGQIQEIDNEFQSRRRSDLSCLAAPILERLHWFPAGLICGVPLLPHCREPRIYLYLLFTLQYWKTVGLCG